MKKNGFTLIELLAVIAVLAIILLIAVPQVLTIISSSKQQAAVKSAMFAWEAAEAYIGSQSMGGTVPTANVTYAQFNTLMQGGASSSVTAGTFTNTNGTITGIAANVVVSSGGTTYNCIATSPTTKSAITCS